MKELTILTREQIYGKDRLEIFEKYGEESAITDYAILQGGYYHYNNFTKEGKELKNRTGWYWTKTEYEKTSYEKKVIIIDDSGEERCSGIFKRNVGIRPIVSFSEIKNKINSYKINKFGVKEVEYGEYPQTIVSEEASKNLNHALSRNLLKETGKTYTGDLAQITNVTAPFTEKKYKEYEICGTKYVLFDDFKNYNVDRKLSDGRTIEEFKQYWLEVEPIKWLVDEEKDIAITKNIIAAGIPFSNKIEYEGNFDKTDIKEYIDKYLIKEIVSRKNKREQTVKDIKKENLYEFNYDEVSEEEIIKGAIESNISVFLHGRSSEGKSARVKQIDPNCVIIYLRNATPESLNGKSVYNQETGEMIDIKPTWLKKLENICEKEPDKNHIVFFDEITNALPSIQGIAFNIVLDKEVNGMWKLPDNARIVAAGNEMNDSLAANQLAEPLFNRFAHVYIETTVDKWLEWASKNNIHPAIYAYIAYRKDDALRSKYNGEKPNADPRKWEMASNILYKTRRPEMLRALLGTDITNEFIWFTKQKVITLEDILNDNYSEEDLNLNTGEKYMTVVGLLNAKEEDYQKVLEFLKKLGNEFISIFNTLWTKDNEERLEIIAESKQDIKKKIRKI